MIFIGIHIPKTAGATFKSHLEAELNFNEFYQSTSLIQNAIKDLPFLEEKFNCNSFKIIFGHLVDEDTIRLFHGKQIYLFSFLRAPVERFISHYLFDCRMAKILNHEHMSFTEFYSKTTKNFMCNWLTSKFPVLSSICSGKTLHEKAIFILKNFRFVCSTDDFDDKIHLLLNELGVNPKIAKKMNASALDEYSQVVRAVDFEKIKLENQEDMKLMELYNIKNDVSNLNPFGFDKPLFDLYLNKLNEININRYETLMRRVRVGKKEYSRFGVLDREQDRAKNQLMCAMIKLAGLTDKKGGEIFEQALKEFQSLDINL